MMHTFDGIDTLIAIGIYLGLRLLRSGRAQRTGKGRRCSR
jgi:hypothetical protein